MIYNTFFKPDERFEQIKLCEKLQLWYFMEKKALYCTCSGKKNNAHFPTLLSDAFQFPYIAPLLPNYLRKYEEVRRDNHNDVGFERH